MNLKNITTKVFIISLFPWLVTATAAEQAKPDKQEKQEKQTSSTELKKVPLVSALRQLLHTNPQILEKHSKFEKAKFNETKVRADLFPKIDLTTDWGSEKIHNSSGKNKPDGTLKRSNTTDTGRSSHKIELTQLIYDWGATGGKVDGAYINTKIEEWNLKNERLKLLFTGTKAYFELHQKFKELEFAKWKMDRYRKVVAMEKRLTKGGRKGRKSDYYHSQTKYFQAVSEYQTAQTVLEIAKGTYWNIFGGNEYDFEIKSVNQLEKPFYYRKPKSLAEVFNAVKTGNYNLEKQKEVIKKAGTAISSARAKLYYPKLSLKLEGKTKHQDGGVMGTKDELLAKLELKWTIFAGGKDLANYKSELEEYNFKLHEKNKLYRKAQSAAWKAFANMVLADDKIKTRRKSLASAQRFYKKASRERDAGKRSLLSFMDSLNGIWTAEKRLLDAETKGAIAVYNVYNVAGVLDLTHFLKPSRDYIQKAPAPIEKMAPAKPNKSAKPNTSPKQNTKPKSSKPTAQSTQPKAAPKAAEASKIKGIYLQVGAYKSKTNAKQMVAKFADKQIQAGVNIIPPKPSSKLFRVHIGPFKSPTAANKTRDRVANMGVKDVQMVSYFF